MKKAITILIGLCVTATIALALVTSQVAIVTTSYAPIQIQSSSSVTNGVTIYEHNQAGTTDYLVKWDPTVCTTSCTCNIQPVRHPAGTKTVIVPPRNNWYAPGQTVACVESVSANVTFDQEEQ